MRTKDTCPTFSFTAVRCALPTAGVTSWFPVRHIKFHCDGSRGCAASGADYTIYGCEMQALKQLHSSRLHIFSPTIHVQVALGCDCASQGVCRTVHFLKSCLFLR